MRIELDRLVVPEDLGREEECGICGRTFEIGIVWAQIIGDRYGGGTDEGVACPACIEALGRLEETKPADRYPTIEEYRSLEREWGTTAQYSSMEEWGRAEREEWERERQSCK